MKPDQSYVFHLDLSRAQTFAGPSKSTGTQVNFDQPSKLRIWAGHSPCDRVELLAETGLVSNLQWQDYSFVLSPSEAFTHLVFEAFHETSVGIPYNGNILLDNASRLVPIAYPADMVDRGKALTRHYEFSDSIFGEDITIVFFKQNDTLAEQLADAVFSKGREFESGLKEGLLEMENAGWNRFQPNPIFRKILLRSIELEQESKGHFDVGRQIDLKQLWVASAIQFGRIPSKQEIQEILDETGIRKIGMRRDSVFWAKELDVQFDWSGLAKALAIDEMATMLAKDGRFMYGVKSRDMAIGHLEELHHERPYFALDSIATESQPVHLSAIVTSQADELLLEINGEKYYDQINPMRGQLIDVGRIVTVEAKDCVTAYAWSQALLGSVEGEVLFKADAHVIRKWISTNQKQEAN